MGESMGMVTGDTGRTFEVMGVEWPLGKLTLGDMARIERKMREQHIAATSDTMASLPNDVRMSAMRDAAERASKMSFLDHSDEYCGTVYGIATVLHFAIASGLRATQDKRDAPRIEQLQEAMGLRDVARFAGDGSLLAAILGIDPKEVAARLEEAAAKGATNT